MCFNNGSEGNDVRGKHQTRGKTREGSLWVLSYLVSISQICSASNLCARLREKDVRSWVRKSKSQAIVSHHLRVSKTGFVDERRVLGLGHVKDDQAPKMAQKALTIVLVLYFARSRKRGTHKTAPRVCDSFGRGRIFMIIIFIHSFIAAAHQDKGSFENNYFKLSKIIKRLRQQQE